MTEPTATDPSAATEPDRPTVPLVEVTISAPIEEVWAHLRDPELVARWFGWSYDGLADEIELIFEQGAQAIEPADGTDDPFVLFWDHGPEHRDRIELHRSGTGTRVRVTRPAPLGATTWDGIFDDVAEGWISFIEQLRFALDHHRGADRRTVFVASPVTSGPADGAAGRLGPGVASGAPGAAITGPVGPEGAWTGSIEFRHPHQVGLRIDQLGPGLVVVLDKPAADDRPGETATAMATITTYGLDEAEHEGIEARWQAWWAAEVGPPTPLG